MEWPPIGKPGGGVMSTLAAPAWNMPVGTAGVTGLITTEIVAQPLESMISPSVATTPTWCLDHRLPITVRLPYAEDRIMVR